MNTHSVDTRIAIVGTGGILPGSADLAEFWSNVLAGHDASRDVPPGRWPLDPASILKPGGPSPDKVYSLRGYFLDRTPTDPDVDPGLDALFHLAVAIGRMAWTDAVMREVDRRRVGVVLGSIALPTERISKLSREILGPLFRGEPAPVVSVDPRNTAVVGRPAVLVAEVLGLGGLCLTLDAACASSLYALKIACEELRAGRADAMLAGGLNRSDSLYTQMGFSQLRALSPSGRCSPFDARADGLLVGEGGVVFVLKRLADAERAGDHIYGVIAGIGLSNDVGGSLLAPASEGQLRAMRSAYAEAGWRPCDVEYIECHATGTPVGDAVELASLRALWADETRRCALGAVKSTVGHLLTGAGAAGLLKVLLAMRHEILPPTANFHTAPAKSLPADGPFEVLRESRPWQRRNNGTSRRAAINAFGFGGVNAHVLIEEYVAPDLRLAPAAFSQRGLNDESRMAKSSAGTSPSFGNRARIAVVGLDAHFGPWSDREAFAQRVFALGKPLATDHDRPLEEVSIPLDRLRTPPSELDACLGQQLLLLCVAAKALDDAGGIIDPDATGAFIGIALDANTTNYDFRWAQPSNLRDAAGPPLNADRVMGSLGSIAASRLARAFDFGGPSFTLSAEDSSGLVALKLALRALQRGELRQALVGAVDLPADVRTRTSLGQKAGPFCDGAAALILMPLKEAEQTGRHVYAIIDDSQGAAIAVDAAEDIGFAGAASAMASIVKACLTTDRDQCATIVHVDAHSIVFTPSGHKAKAAQEPRKTGRSLTIPPRRLPFETPSSTLGVAAGGAILADPGRFTAVMGAVAQAHETFLRFTGNNYASISKTLARQSALLEKAVVLPGRLVSLDSRRSDVLFDRSACLAFAVGKIRPVLGSDYSIIDQFPTRVRLPDEPLMLVDRIVSIEGEPRCLSRGRIVTEHDVLEDRWYLDNGVAPPSIAIESGQADLFLAAWLGVDFHTKGHAVYRLLDAAVTFHRELPRPGETVRYDIRIKEFFRQGETLLFRFEFDGAVNGEPVLTMRDGCAGFFTPAELSAGQGVVRGSGKASLKPSRSAGLGRSLDLPKSVEAYSAMQLDALRNGDLAACFGRVRSDPINRGSVNSPLTLPKHDRLRLVHRVTRFEPTGGQFGLGLIRGEADIHPDDWFLTCHFIDDQVMPGTLMYECCLHTLRIALLRLGWIGDVSQVSYQPVLGVTSRLKCRGQVTAATKTVAYEVSIKELGDDPEPYAIADAMMFADGKPIVDVQDMTLRLQGLKRTASRAGSEALDRRQNDVLFTRERILEFAAGSPSRAFGDRYEPFDRDRFIARLPAPPYSFLDRIVAASVEPWTMKAGGSATAEYDVPPDAWYFAAAGQPRMPYAILLEIALQAAGWVSAYIGSALHSDEDLHYRNLGGRGTVLRPVRPDAGTLVTTVTLTKVSKSAGMIIQHFDFAVRDSAERDLYVGDTYFGFFTASALRNQVGLRSDVDVGWVESSEPTKEAVGSEDSTHPTRTMLQMLDWVELWRPDGGPHGRGLIRGCKDIDPAEWFFKAHFFHDPVWPGSLGLEAFLQLLQFAAVKRWGEPASWESPALNVGHQWIYRGQVTPRDRRVTVQAEITRMDDAAHTLHADGWLLVDDRVIYQMTDFAFRHTK